MSIVNKRTYNLEELALSNSDSYWRVIDAIKLELDLDPHTSSNDRIAKDILLKRYPNRRYYKCGRIVEGT